MVKNLKPGDVVLRLDPSELFEVRHIINNQYFLKKFFAHPSDLKIVDEEELLLSYEKYGDESERKLIKR